MLSKHRGHDATLCESGGMPTQNNFFLTLKWRILKGALTYSMGNREERNAQLQGSSF